MSKKLINQDPFHSGTEHLAFETYNCDKCIKSSILKKDQISYTNADENNMPRCSIQRDIVLRAIGNEPIKEETIKICKEFTLYGVLCPYLKTEYPKKKSKKTDKNQIILEL